MKTDTSKRTLIAIVGVVAAAIVFWILLISPKMKEKDELGTEAESLQVSLSQAQSEVAAAEGAKKRFPKNYRQLVLLGKAVPASDETASLLVQMNTVANKSKSELESIELNSTGGGEAAAAAETTEGEAAPGATPTEAEAALLPLGATVGPAGFSVMPYELTFNGNFFSIADFINGIDSLVQTENPGLTVDGRLLTIDAFSMSQGTLGFPHLKANFAVNAYVAPPGQGLTGSSSIAGAATTTESEIEAGAEEETETTEGTPSADVSEEAK